MIRSIKEHFVSGRVWSKGQGVFFILFFLHFFIRCVDFTAYSDANEVLAVRADIVSSEDVVIDNEKIVSAEDGRIILNIKGKIEESLPLTIETDFELSPESKILYGEKYREFVFHSVQDSFRFQVIAQSGLPKKWIVKLADVRNGDGDITHFDIVSYKAEGKAEDLIAAEGKIYKSNLVEIFVNTQSDTVFPIEVTPEISISENGRLINYKAGEALKFENPQSVQILKIEAENKSIQEWRIVVRTPDSDDVNLKGGTFVTFTDCLEVADTLFAVDTLEANAVVKVAQVRDWKNFNVLLQYKLKLPVGGRMVFLEGETEDFTNTKAIFNRIEDIRKFKIVSQSGKEKIWKIKLDYRYDRTAEAESFSIDSWEPKEEIDLSVDASSAIDNTARTLAIDINSGVKKITEETPLSVYPVLKLSAKAFIKDLEAEQGNIYRLPLVVFDDVKTVYPFSIYSESGEEFKWSIVLVDKQKDKSASAEVENLMLHPDRLPEGVVFTEEVFLPEKEVPEIVLKLKQVKFPFLLTDAAYTLKLSDGANMPEGKKNLVFEKIGDRQTVRIEAENGTEKVWTIRLDYTQNAGADITALRISQLFPAGIGFEREGKIDAVNGVVTLQVTDASTAFPLRADVETTVSANARIEPGLKNLVFANENQLVKIHVIAESGITREWTVRLLNQVVKSDQANIESFVAESMNPEITIGKAELDGNTAAVEILSGKNKFPLSLDIDQSILSEGASADKVILTFENISRTEIINVTSQNGKVTNAYTVKLIDRIPLSDSCDIVRMKPERYLPLGYKLSGNVELLPDENKALVEVYGQIDQPIVLWLDALLSEGATWQSALPAHGIEFLSADETKEYTVISESKKTKTWKIGLKLLDAPKNTEALIKDVEATNEENIVIQPVIKDNKDITLYVGNAQPKYPFVVKASLSISPNAKVKVNNARTSFARTYVRTRATEPAKVVWEGDIVFNSVTDQVKVTVIAEDGLEENNYNVGLGGEKIENTEANVLEYKIESYFPMNLPEAPLVFGPDAESGRIVINAPDEDVFPFTIYPQIRLSYGAVLRGLNTGQMTIEKGFFGQDFEVVSESGVVKKWRLEVKVAEKSKENQVTAFSIQTYTPQAAGLGKPEIRTAERKIVIPVADWQKGERLTIEAVPIEVSPKATTDFRTNLFFQSAKDEYVFHVTAQNGEVAEWKVVLDYTSSDRADITAFRVLTADPASVTYNADAVIDENSNTVYIDVIDHLTFPFTITADVVFSAKSEVDWGGITDNRIRFDKYQDSTLVKVTAEDEVNRKNWKIKLRYHFSEEADITVFDIVRYQPSGIILADPATRIDAAGRVVFINIADWNGQTNLQITPALQVSEKATYQLNGDLLFVKKTSEAKTIQVTAESGNVLPWNIKLNYEENSGAEITGIRYTGYEPSDITFLGASIDNKNSVVTLELQTWNGHTEFTVKGLTCALSPKATANIPEEITFRKLLQENFEYTVTAQDGSTKKWTFKLLYHESSAAEVTKFRITGSNKEGIISMATTAVIGDGTIDIDLNSGVRDAFESGFQINVEAELSPKATSDIPATLMFSKPTDQRRYTVTAESGATKEWAIRFVNKASQETGLLALRAVTIESATTSDLADFKFSDLKVDGNTVSFTVTDVITSNKYNLNWPTLNLNLDLQLSARAKIKEGNVIGVAIADAGTRALTVLADDGIHQATYHVVVSYKPQLENANLDNWSDGKTPGGSIWSTANNTFVSGTSRTDGKSGYAARMSTSEAVGMKAAGTIFLGTFKFTSLTDALNDPEKMTYFGVPFPGRPRQLKVDVQYKPGNGKLNDGTGDKGQVWVALEYWPDPNNAKNANNKRYAYGEVMLSQTIGSWTTYTIDLRVIDAGVVPTHLLVVASSSYDGNHFNAVVGSEMKIDNIELVY